MLGVSNGLDEGEQDKFNPDKKEFLCVNRKADVSLEISSLEKSGSQLRNAP